MSSVVAKPHRLIVLLAALVAFGPLSIDMYLASLPTIAQELQAREAHVQMSVGVFLAGLCCGMLLYGPLSDRCGRRRLLLGSILLYVLASAGCALAGSIEALLGWRLLQALGGAAASVLGRAIVRDLFPLQDAARVLSLMHLVTMLATLLAPLLGSYLMLLAGWRAQFWLLLAFAGLCLLAVLWRIPETLPAGARHASLGQAFAAYGLMLRERQALAYGLCAGLAFAGMFAFISASPFVYIEYFKVSARDYGLLFGLNVLGIIVMTALNAWLLPRLSASRLLRWGSAQAAVAGLLLALCGLTGWGGLPALVLAVLLYVSVTGLIGANSLACLLAAYPNQSGAAAGLAVAGQFGLGMLCSGLVGLLYGGTPLAMCLIMALAGCGSWLALRLL